jgi:hypothetical protein
MGSQKGQELLAKKEQVILDRLSAFVRVLLTRHQQRGIAVKAIPSHD